MFGAAAFRAEEFPENLLRATADLKKVNLIPAIGESQLNPVKVLDVC